MLKKYEENDIMDIAAAIKSKSGNNEKMRVADMAERVRDIPTGNNYVPKYEDKTVTPKKTEQVLTPSSGYDGFKLVTVNPIPDEYVVPYGTKNIITNGDHDVSAYRMVNVNVPTSGEGGGTPDYSVNYKAFGAKGDGITNDAIAIKACHEYANANSLPVINNGGLYAIRGYDVDTAVEIKTDLIFHDGGFIFDDYNTLGTFFSVPGTFEPNQTKQLSQVFDSPTTVADAYVGKSFNITFNSAYMAFAWYADKTDMRNVAFPVFAGSKNTKFPMDDWDLLKNEQVTVSEIQSMRDTLTLSGFTIHYNMEHYLRFANVSRSNVIFDRISVTTEGIDGSGLGDIIRVNNCANIVVRDCSGEDTDGYDSPQYGYLFQLESVANVVIERLTSKMMWTALGTHYINGFTMRDCNTERFDCHFCQMGDVILDGCVFTKSVEIGWGFGRTRVRDCLLEGSVLYRPDVNGCYNGNIYIDNCRSTSTYLLNLWNEAMSATLSGYLANHNGMGDIHVSNTEYNTLVNDPWFVGYFNRRGNIYTGESEGGSCGEEIPEGENLINFQTGDVRDYGSVSHTVNGKDSLSINVTDGSVYAVITGLQAGHKYKITGACDKWDAMFGIWGLPSGYSDPYNDSTEPPYIGDDNGSTYARDLSTGYEITLRSGEIGLVLFFWDYGATATFSNMKMIEV